MNKSQRCTAVWLDQRRALVIHYFHDNEEMEVIMSGVDESRPKGGAGTSIPYGKQEAISERTYLERKKQQLKKFYEQVIQRLENSDRIMLMGPAEAKVGLEKIIETNPQLSSRVELLDTMDSLTDNQIKAEGRDYFA